MFFLDQHHSFPEIIKIYRRFYYRFGVDVANAQTLNAKDAGELAERVRVELAKNGIDGTVNAASYFALNQ